MRVEVRNGVDRKSHQPAPQCLVLISENEHESELIDAIFGTIVDSEGLISTKKVEARLSNGCDDHHLRIYR